MPSTQPNPHDTFFRRILARPEKAAEFLRWYLPAPIVAELDLNEVSYADTAFADAKLRKHFSDLLLRVRLRKGGEAYVLILLEHKSAPDPRVAIQVLRYAALLWDQSPLPLPLIIPVVVYHGAEKWRVGKKFSDLFGALPAGRHWLRYLPDFEYHLCDLSQYADDELHGKDGLAAQLKLLKYIFRPELTERLPNIISEFEQTVPATRVLEEIGTMLNYLEYAGRPDEKVLNRLRAELELTEDDHKAARAFLFKLARAYGVPELTGEAIAFEDAERQGMAVMALSLLEHNLGKLKPAAVKKVQKLAASELKKLGTELLAFGTHKDLDQWLRQHTQAKEKQN